VYSGKMWRGPKTYTLLKYDLSQIPLFPKAGAIIPKIPLSHDVLGVARRPFTNIDLDFVPGTTSGSTKIYEDDGETVDYVKDSFFWTYVNYTRSQNIISLTISHSNGTFSNKPSSRIYRFNLLNFPPLSERFSNLNGANINYNKKGGPNTWRFDGVTFATVVESGPVSTDSNSVLKAVFQVDTMGEGIDMDGYRGWIYKSYLSKRTLDQADATPGSQTDNGGLVSIFASSADQLEYLIGRDPALFYELLSSFPNLFKDAYNEIMALKPQKTSAQRVAYSQALMETALYPPK